jgi:predicted HTH transcriptional regulator
MPTKSWTESDLTELVRNAVEESLALEYKAAKALQRSDGAKRQITKDVSSMANSAGGTIIYGIKEYDDPQRRHLPECIDPIDRVEYPREWLEQVINQIQPRILGLVIHTIALEVSPLRCAYVVDVTASDTAHQATDCRYYRRFNFEAVPMVDYEVRDVMGRRMHPLISLEFPNRR